VFYSDDGTTAVEVALKLALQYWSQNGQPRRKRFVALDQAFHGESLGAISVGGVEIIRRHFAGVLFDCLHVPPGRKGFDAAFEALPRLLHEQRDEVAGVVVEPMVQGFAGMRIYDAGYLRLARECTRAVDTFLICDEVFTGYGRTGPMWACDHAEIAPDILCSAKGFTAGILPMAATLASERVFSGFLGGKERAFLHGHTYAGHPLGAAIAREVLSIYREEQILEHAAAKAKKIASCFAALARLPGVSESRSLGMIGAVELGARAGYLEPLGWRVYEEALKRGAYLRPLGNVVYTVPPLNITDSDLDRLLSILTESIEAVL
jgi:adenosylmethionine-8-amino-7-oxononanoate aminotransferase